MRLSPDRRTRPRSCTYASASLKPLRHTTRPPPCPPASPSAPPPAPLSCSFCSSYCCSCSALQRPHRAPSVQAAAPQMRFAPLLPPVAANYCHPKPKISVFIQIFWRRTIYVTLLGTIRLDCVHTIPSSTMSCFFQGSPQFLQLFGLGPILEIGFGPPTAERKKHKKKHKSSNILVHQP